MRGFRAAALLTFSLLAGACGERACGGLGGRPPAVPPIVKDKDGRVHYVVDRGPYRAYYDTLGQLERIEHDSNGDGRGDYIIHYDPARRVGLVEVDEDFDGWVDRWEYYDVNGVLERVGRARHGHRADVWTYPASAAGPARTEYDEDGDGKVDRIDIEREGRVVRVEIDANRDGRMDRWQSWEAGRLRSEELDTDGDGRPDRRIRYGSDGKVRGIDTIRP